MSGGFHRSSSKIFPEDKEWIDMMKGYYSEEDKRRVSFPEAVHRILNHYKQLCEEYNLKVETMEVIKNAKNIEEE